MKKRKQHLGLWIDEDGNVDWGHVTLFDTRYWSDIEIGLVEMSRPAERLKTAKEIDKKYRRIYKAALELIDEAEGVDIRAFRIDEEGVSEIDPETGEDI